MLKTSIVHSYRKHREQISYLFFGVLTTIVNYVSFALLRSALGDEWLHVGHGMSFIIATLFAYITNRLFVFRSKRASLKKVLHELSAFFGSRVSTFFIEALGLYICTDFFHVGQYRFAFMDGTMLAKIILSFVAVILNYFLSKFFVFKNTGGKKHNETPSDFTGL